MIKMRGETPKNNAEDLKLMNKELQDQLNDALEKLASAGERRSEGGCDHETIEKDLKLKIEQLEAELEVTKDELRLRQEEVNAEQDKLSQQLNNLQVSLKFLSSPYFTFFSLLA